LTRLRIPRRTPILEEIEFMRYSAPIKRSVSNRILAAVAAVVLVSMSLVPIASAAPRAVLGELFTSAG
jgi:hypothetical protein